MNDFQTAYQALNKDQKKAVDTTEGTVMVIAGPGTGKTQVLALRIANILNKTDVGADALLCLTFTRSGVTAMKNRLESYIGPTARNVNINTFHSFASEIVEKYYSVIDFNSPPVMLDDNENIAIVDELLHSYEWEYIRPRTNPSQYFGDLKSLISILKRERMTPETFLLEVENEISFLTKDPESISTRGDNKGGLKKEIEKKIESLNRTKEVVEFYRLYEDIKKQKNFMDYDDVLEYAVKIIEESDDARDDIRETYQYILIDEHQDSSGIQNSFLKAVWGGVEKPNIFVVGDDRQLIYGFSGASLSYFEEFASFFGKTEIITLSENYRSVNNILTLADDLLKSSVTKEKLNSNISGDNKILLAEYFYERDEILGAGLFFKNKIENGDKPEECALLVPKNRNVKNAINILRDMNLPVSSPVNSSLFDLPNAESLFRVLKIISDPFNSVLLSEALLDKNSNVSAFIAHKALHEFKNTNIDLNVLNNYGVKNILIEGEHPISTWAKKLTFWIENLSHERISRIVSTIGNELLINNSNTHEDILKNTEIVRSFLHIAMVWEDKNPNQNISSFLNYLLRMKEYGQNVEIAAFSANSGIQVMTLHRSKGLEYKNVWIAHMNEQTFMSQRRQAFTLPERVKQHINERDIASAKRELYVAITRAKEMCTISYSQKTHDGKSLDMANMIADLSGDHFIKNKSEETERELLSDSIKIYIPTKKESQEDTQNELKKYVTQHYNSIKVSVTLLNNFFSCPWKWYFRNFLRLPEVKGVSLALGSAVHSTIEFILKKEKKPSLQEIKEKINNELKKEGVIETKELSRLSVNAITAVTNWMDVYYENLSENRISERSISFRDPVFPHLQMYGKIDLTEKFENGDIIVTDFKTGSVKTANAIEKTNDDQRLSDYMRQLAMYSYLIKGAEKGSIVTNSRLLFVEADIKDKNSVYETHISNEQVDLLTEDIKEYDEQLMNGSWMKRQCGHKAYPGNIDCEYCKLSKLFY